MATNGDISAGDTEMAECDGQEIVTMMDVLKEQQEFEDDANAVLGGSDEKECTYSQGYIKRQAIYACMTCCPESNDDPSKRAGFCLACSLSCHENHDLVELYTKRNFRCDCGNPKFKSPCQFTPSKPELNTENIYNQNFVGLYCSCSQPYGEHESALDDEMIQCIICEDWWHATHLDAVVPAPDQYSEMVCKLCMAKNEFLHDYSDLTVNVETGDVDVVQVNGNDNIETDKLTNGSMTEEKLTNGNDMDSTDIEMSTIEAPKENKTIEAIPEITENETSSTEKESINTNHLEDDTPEPKKLEEDTSDAPMNTDETDKVTEVLPEVNPEDKLESTEDKGESVKPSGETANNTISEKTEEKNETSEVNELSEEKVDVSKLSEEKEDESTSASAENVAEKTTGVQEKDENAESSSTEADKSEPSKENNEGAAQVDLETTNAQNITEVTENSSESMNTNENKVNEDQVKESDAEKEVDQESTKTDSPDVETDKPSAGNGENDKRTVGDTTTAPQDEEMNDISKENKDEIVSQTSSDKDLIKVDVTPNDETSKIESTNIIESDNNKIEPELVSTENKRKIDDATYDISVKKPKLDESKCLRPKGVKKVHRGATFWPSTFRQKLCTCNECISMYKDLSVLFLTDLEDTVLAYETLGKERTAGNPNQYEKGIEALCSLGRIQQIDALTEYNKMRDKLLTFLQSFKDKKEIVTEHDIKSFFAGMKPEKRTDGVYFCR